MTDLNKAFKKSLQKSLAEKIFDTIPEHVFWDIKKPLGTEVDNFTNPYNPFRGVPFTSFFDRRDYEEYMDRRILKANLKDAVSTYRKY